MMQHNGRRRQLRVQLLLVAHGDADASGVKQV